MLIHNLIDFLVIHKEERREALRLLGHIHRAEERVAEDEGPNDSFHDVETYARPHHPSRSGGRRTGQAGERRGTRPLFASPRDARPALVPQTT